MSQKSAVTYRFELKRSKTLLYLVVLTHAAALVACFVNGFDYALQFLLAALVSLSFSLHLKCASGPPSIREILVRQDGWRIVESGANGIPKPVELMGESVCSVCLVLLIWRDGRKIGRQLILPDHLDADDFRRLRVALRMAQIQ